MKVNLEQLRRTIPNSELEDYLKAHPELNSWIMRKSIHTKTKYLRNLIRYSEALKDNDRITESSPNGLLELARHQTEEEKPHVEVLEEFQTSLEEVLTETQRAMIFSISITVKSFYNFKGYTFPRFRGNFSYTPREKTAFPKLENLQTDLEKIKNFRTRTVFALESSAPIRMESLLALRWKHFRETLENKELPMIRLEATELKGKNKAKYQGIKQICFLTPFAKSYVLRYRTVYEEETKRKIDLADPQSLELPFLISTSNCDPLTYMGLNSCLERAKAEGYPFRVHIYRTYVNEALMKIGISKEHRDTVLGHKLKAIDRAYSMNEIETLRKEFKNAVKFLDPTYKEDENIQRIKESIKRTKGIDLTDSEAKEVLDSVMMKFFGSG